MVLYVTAPEELAKKIARSVVEARLVACVSMFKVSSMFWWEGKVDVAEETLMIIKTTKDMQEAAAEHIKTMHEYQVPEIIALPITGGLPAYLQWVRESTTR